MMKTAGILVGAVASAALIAPSLAVPAQAVPAADSAQVHAKQLAKPKKGKAKLSIKAKKGYVHFNLTSDVVTVKVKGAKKGKVKFTIDGADAGTVKLKKRAASLAIPASLAIGEHVVKASMKKAKSKSIKIVSYNTTMTLSTTAVTVNRATYDAPSITGQVIFKGAVANDGYVDSYNDDGDITIGSESPDLLGVSSVDANGAVEIYTHDYLDFAPGVYTMKVFFEYDAGYDEYLFGTPITVTVV